MTVSDDFDRFKANSKIMEDVAKELKSDMLKKHKEDTDRLTEEFD